MGKMADMQDSNTPKVGGNQAVTLNSPYEPISVKDQFGNRYVCLSWYEVTRLYDMMISMQSRGIRDYDTGDWWLDLPPKLDKWLKENK